MRGGSRGCVTIQSINEPKNAERRLRREPSAHGMGDGSTARRAGWFRDRVNDAYRGRRGRRISDFERVGVPAYGRISAMFKDALRMLCGSSRYHVPLLRGPSHLCVQARP